MNASTRILCAILSLDFFVASALKVNAANDFSNTGSMNTARQFHTAIQLANGKALVAGGYDINNSALSSAELFDPDTGVWTNTGSMGLARQRHSAILLANGKVLVAGGGDLPNAELFDPATGTWSNTGPMEFARSSHTVLCMNRIKGFWCFAGVTARADTWKVKRHMGSQWIVLLPHHQFVGL